MSVVVILLFLILPANASFFDTIQSTFTSVESVISDVVSDAKVTIDCTVMAVQHALSWDGILKDSFDENCKDVLGINAKPSESASKDPSSIERPPDVYIKFEEIKGAMNNATKELSLQITEDVNTIDKTIDSYFDTSNDTFNKIDHVETVLNNETKNIGAHLLTEQLNNMSANVEANIGKIQAEEIDMKKLLDEITISSEEDIDLAKKTHSPVVDVAGTRHIDTISDDGEEKLTNTTLVDLKDQLAQFKEKEQEELGELKTILESKDEDAFPKNFKDYAIKVFDESSASNSGPSTNKETNVPDKILETAVTSESPALQTPEEEDPWALLSAYLAPEDGQAQEKAIKEAAAIIIQSRKTQSLLNKFYENVGESDPKPVFENPELLK